MQERSISIFGKVYTIRANDSDPDLHEVCQYLEDRFRVASDQYPKRADIEKSILSAIQISFDYFALKKEKEELRRKFRQDSERLLSLINSKIELFAEAPAAR